MSLYGFYMRERQALKPRNEVDSACSSHEQPEEDLVGAKRKEKERQQIASQAIKRFANGGFSGTLFQELQRFSGAELDGYPDLFADWRANCHHDETSV